MNFTSLFILFFLFAFNVKASKIDKLFVAKNGIFDFSKDQNLNDGISLKGDWSFYWKDFLKPEDVQKEIIPRGEKRETHGVWLGDKSKGYATYLLKLKGLKPGNYILSDTYIYSSFKIYLINKKTIQTILNVGDLSSTPKKDVPIMDYLSVNMKIEDGPHYLMIHVSNYHFRNGGIDGYFKLFLKKPFDSEKTFNIVIDSFVIGSLFIVGLYHLFIFFLRPKDLLSLWFGIAVIFLGSRAYLSPGYIHWLFSDYGVSAIELKTKIYYLTFYPAPFFIGKFADNLLDGSLNRKLLGFLKVYFFITTAFVIFLDVSFYASIYIFYTFCLITTVTIFYIIFKFSSAIWKKQYHYILSFIPMLIMCFGGIHDIVINFQADKPIYISSYCVLLFILFQSYNIAKKNAIAHNTAENLTLHLEREVLGRTKEAQDARDKAEESQRKVSELINNMRQAVFIVNSNAETIEPVSIFSNEIFGMDVGGKSVFESIYKNIDRKSEQFSKINMALEVIFNADDLQWAMMKDLLPDRVLYRENKDDTDKILRVINTPLFSNEGILERLMYVIEDITEVERLEKEMIKEREKGNKKSILIQELVVNKKEDLNFFFEDTIKIFNKAMANWKNLRVLISEKKPLVNLEDFLRDLHTIKGNSRIYGLSLISNYTHEIETKFSELRLKSFDKWTSNDISEFTQDLYGLQGQINEYLWPAEEILGVESEQDKILKEEYHEGLKELEYWLSHFYNGQKHNEVDLEPHFSLLSKIGKLDSDYRDQIFLSIKRQLHGLKGISRSIGNNALSENIHFLETHIIELETKNYDPNIILEEFFPTLEDVRMESYRLFLNSSQNRPLDLSDEAWIEMFVELFKVVHLLEKGVSIDSEGFKKANYILAGKIIGQNLFYLPAIMRYLYDLIELDIEAHEERVNISFCLNSMWDFFSIVFSLNSSYEIPISVRESIINELNNIFLGEIEKKEAVKEIEKWGKRFGWKEEPLIIGSIKDILKEGFSFKEIYKTFKFFNDSEDRNFYNFIPIEKIHIKFNETFSAFIQCLKDGDSNFTLLEDYLNNDEDLRNKDFAGIMNLFKLLLSNQNPIWFHYLLNIDLLRALKKYYTLEEEEEFEMSPDSVDVLSQNFEVVRDRLMALNESESLKEEVEKQFNLLLEVPLKYSFKNLKSMVKDVGKTLGKKVKLQLNGDQASIGKDKLSLLKDAVIHIVRNALDHGIEDPKERVKKGKKEVGEIVILCKEVQREEAHSNFNKEEIRIIIKDDGRGINSEKVCERAIKMGLIKAEELKKLSEEEKMGIIFNPGLTTKEKISEISGRGIGMDVVKTNLQKINADIKIKNYKGLGTEFHICINK